jgi:hypothetical protein
MSTPSTVRSFRLRPNTLAALKAAAGEAGLSPNRAAELIMRAWLAQWAAARLQEQRDPAPRP